MSHSDEHTGFYDQSIIYQTSLVQQYAWLTGIELVELRVYLYGFVRIGPAERDPIIEFLFIREPEAIDIPPDTRASDTIECSM